MNTRSCFNALDVGKFVAALLVVAIHANPFEHMGAFGEMMNSCILRLAVPFFFLSSSFLFFRRTPHWGGVLHYVKRILLLYIFWALFSIPIFYIYHTPPYGHPIGIMQLVSNFFLGSVYPGSWFLITSVECVLLIWLLTYRLNSLFVFVICLFLFLFYHRIFDNFLDNSIVLSLHKYEGNWAYASIYFFLGKWIADHENILIQSHSMRWGGYSLFLLLLDIVSFFLLYPYAFEVHTYMLPIISCTIVLFVLNAEISVKLPYKEIRKMSISFYLSHFTFVALIAFILHHYFSHDWSLLRYILVIFCCFILFLILNSLSSKKGFSWLKYAF